MTTERDPRWEPVVGDVLKLRRRGQMQIAVTAVDVRGVSYEQQVGGTWAAIANMDYWRAWASSATVVKKGGEG